MGPLLCSQVPFWPKAEEVIDDTRKLTTVYFADLGVVQGTYL